MEGWGAHLKDLQISGTWDSNEKKSHINQLEMVAVLKALTRFAPFLVGQKIGLMSDNCTVVAYLNKQGGTRSKNLCDTARKVLQLSEAHFIDLRAKYIPGKRNVLADALSRRNQVIGTEWTLRQDVANAVIDLWGLPSLDLFATNLNHRLPQYFSPLKDAAALGEDAFQHSWNNLDVYAYPPHGLVQQVLARVRQAKNLSMTLIAPLHARAVWFPDLLELLSDHPVALPLYEDLLSQPLSDRNHRSLKGLNLHAWRLCSESSVRQDFLSRTLETQPKLSDLPRLNSMKHDGNISVIGVIRKISILSKPLFPK